MQDLFINLLLFFQVNVQLCINSRISRQLRVVGGSLVPESNSWEQVIHTRT